MQGCFRAYGWGGARIDVHDHVIYTSQGKRILQMCYYVYYIYVLVHGTNDLPYKAF